MMAVAAEHSSARKRRGSGAEAIPRIIGAVDATGSAGLDCALR